jgi:exopolyphosphatase/guanosine-5'-triphosphate,3'-diphosphate pyrophosphatase
MAESLIARWEWRTFGTTFGAFEDRIKDLPQDRARKSSEVYILSRQSDANTKIRDELMDVKILKQVNEHKLEQWFPVMKEGFPIGRDILEQVFGHWKLPIPEFGKDSYSYAECMEQVIATAADLKSVRVDKHRYGYTVDTCIVEIADLSFDDTPIRTAAVEAADPERVRAVVERLGLGRLENINYVRALKRHAGFRR